MRKMYFKQLILTLILIALVKSAPTFTSQAEISTDDAQSVDIKEQNFNGNGTFSGN
jgi:hypothetical protein